MSEQTNTPDLRLVGAQVSLQGLIESMKLGTKIDREHLAAKLRDGARIMTLAAEWVDDTGPTGGDAWTTPPYELRVAKPSEQPGNAVAGATVIDDFLIGVEVRLEHLAGGAVSDFHIFRQTRAVRMGLLRDAARGLDRAQGQPGLLSAQDQPAPAV